MCRRRLSECAGVRRRARIRLLLVAAIKAYFQCQAGKEYVGDISYIRDHPVARKSTLDSCRATTCAVHT